MSEFASVVERARRAFAQVSQLEMALARDPARRDIQTNLAASLKLANQSQEQLHRLSERSHLEVCNYRLVPEAEEHYGLSDVSKSMLEYQNLFSQIYDAKKNGPKNRAVVGREALDESALEFAYSYSGSLGVVLIARSERNLIEGRLDPSIEAVFQVLDVNDRHAVRDVAKSLGLAVVKRLHDWSDANVKGGFAADIRWNRSDGRQLGEVIERKRMEHIVEVIESTSDEQREELSVVGYLIGGNIQSRNFQFVVPGGEDFRGRLSEEFTHTGDMTLGKAYRARIRDIRTTIYATEKIERKQELLELAPASGLEEMLI